MTRNVLQPFRGARHPIRITHVDAFRCVAAGRAPTAGAAAIAIGEEIPSFTGDPPMKPPGQPAVAAALGGLLWVPYGVFEMLEPWGAADVYRDERGYDVVTDALLYRVYSLPGSLALLLAALGLLGVFALLGLPAGRPGRSGLVLAYAALALAVLSVVGLVVLFDPLFTAPRIFGTLALGAATVLAGVDAHRAGAAPGWTAALLALGLLGLFLLPLWPLAFAVEVMPEGGGAGIIALFGLGWMLVGHRLRSRPSAAAFPIGDEIPPLTGGHSR